MIKTIKGDLLQLFREGEFDHICHGCNVKNAMASGIADQIARQFPEAQQADTKAYYEGLANTGSYSYALIDISKTTKTRRRWGTIINLYTQAFPGRNFNITSFNIGLMTLAIDIPLKAKVGFPKIGAGIGGGDWNEIVKSISILLPKHDITVVEYVPDKVIA